MNKLLIAKHSKSLENPYHFWLGYLLPIANELQKNKDQHTYFVRECGPMTNWLETLKNTHNIKILKPGMLLKYFLDDVPSIVFDNWDNPKNFSSNDIKKSIDYLKKIYIMEEKFKKNKIGILDRNKVLDFYTSGKQEIASSANRVRSINNVEDLYLEISKNFNAELIDTTKFSPRISATKYSELSVLVGQKGAGLTNMIWMDPGSLVIEICAPEILFSEKLDICYEELAKNIGHSFIRVFAQEQWTGDVSIDKILKILNNRKNILK
jgi:hypothetical protein